MNAAVYVRVSKRSQTLENQLPDLERMAAARGLTIVATFSDKMSGSKASRPGFNAMMQAAHEGRFSVVLVWAVDRMGRNMGAVVEAVTTLDRLGVEVVSHKEPWLVLKGPVRALLLSIFAWVAEQERERTIERTDAGLETARRNGKKLGRRQRQVDVDEALRLRKAGRSIRETAKALGIGVGTLHRALARAAA